jgi:CRISPR-associated endoribonuclease Cas6
MRFKLYLKPVRDRQPLLFNYQYPLQAWIYQLLHNADAEYAGFLHRQGYTTGGSRKSFKHFTYSSLQISKAEKVKPGDTYILLRLEPIALFVSFYVDKAAEDFVMGLFQHQQVSLYNREYRADFVVERVETAPPPPNWGEKNTVLFRTVSPMVVAEKVDGVDQYLSPADDAYGRFFAVNLIDKYRSVQNQSTMELDAEAAQRLVKFELVSPPERIKKRGFLVKEGKETKETKVIGYLNFTFAVTAPTELLEVGYLGGFGKYNAVGCGCCEVVNDS